MVERVHLFRHDVGGGTQGTVEQGQVVKGRCLDFRDAVLFHRGLKNPLQVPSFAVGGVEGVVGAAWGVEGGRRGFGGEAATEEDPRGGAAVLETKHFLWLCEDTEEHLPTFWGLRLGEGWRCEMKGKEKFFWHLNDDCIIWCFVHAPIWSI